MKGRILFNVFALSVFSCLLVFSCAAKQSEPWGNAEKGFVLTYHVDPGTKFTITSTGTTEMVSDQMGNEVVVLIDGGGEDAYEVITGGNETGMTLEMEYKARSQNLDSPQGSASTDFSEVLGKIVKYTVSPVGKVDGLEGFDELPEIMSASQEKITKEIWELGAKASFPMLPEKAVKFGDTWTDSDEQDLPASGGTLKIISSSTYTLVEEAVKDGFDCVKIEVANTVTMNGTMEQQGMPLKITRETKGTETIYFAYKKGMYLSRETGSKAEGIVTVESMGIEIPQNITGKGAVTVKFSE